MSGKNMAEVVGMLFLCSISLSLGFMISKSPQQPFTPIKILKPVTGASLWELRSETCFRPRNIHFSSEVEEDEFGFDEMVEEDARVVTLSDNALKHLAELKTKQGKAVSDNLLMRMGVKSGGCSGMSYVLDFMEESEITEEDHIEEWNEHGLKCAIDPKSLLYLYGLQLDYSDELIGGGFEFRNPNAEQTCGCGKSFGV